MNDVRLKLSPPWITYLNKLKALFDPDPQIAFNYKYEDGPALVLATNNADKAVALRKLLPDGKQFGNIVMDISVECPKESNIVFPTPKKLFDAAFQGNPVYAYSVAPAEEDHWWFAMTYVVFKNCVVQFFNDNLNDCHGIISTLYQDIAAEIFADADIGNTYFNTDVERGALGKPLGEWP